MARTYTYSVIRSSWGVRVSITAEVLPAEVAPASVRSVDSQLSVADLTPGQGLTTGAMDRLVAGLRPVASAVVRRLGRPAIVGVRAISYNDADFQEEGISAVRMASEWLTCRELQEIENASRSSAAVRLSGDLFPAL